jgi:DNA helicase II / ATP-dependent DNA helicase PcrA
VAPGVVAIARLVHYIVRGRGASPLCEGCGLQVHAMPQGFLSTSVSLNKLAFRTRASENNCLLQESESITRSNGIYPIPMPHPPTATPPTVTPTATPPTVTPTATSPMVSFTVEQQHVFSLLESTQRNVVISAVAGAGKTSTIVECLNRLPPSKSTLFCAFNRHVADELKTRLPKHVVVGTLHSVGWGIIRKNVPNARVERLKIPMIVWNHCKKEFAGEDIGKRYLQLAPLAMRIVSLMKASGLEESCTVTRGDIRHTMDSQGMDPINNDETMGALVGMVRNAWSVCASPQQRDLVDFDDMIFMPVVRRMRCPKFDVVFVDEAQDLNECQIELVKCLGTRIVGVGDAFQAIYGFRGAMPNALERLAKEIGATSVGLSTCFRCAPEIIRTAQEVVSHISPSPHWGPEQQGVVRTVTWDSMIRMTQPGDHILCRTSTPLLLGAVDLMLAGKLPTIKGVPMTREIGALISLVDSCTTQDTATTQNDATTALAADEEQWMNTTPVDDLGATPDVPSSHSHIPPSTDKCLAVNLMRTAEGKIKSTRLVQTIADKIEKNEIGSPVEMCGDMQPLDRVVFLSSVHRSKGLESNRIFIIRPDLMPHPSAKKPWQLKQEQNLHYVAVTRAKSELYFVE